MIDCLSTSKYSTINFYASVYFRYCSQIVIDQLYVNITSRVPAGITGIYVNNVFSSMIINVKVQINILMCHGFPYVINGLAVYYNGENDAFHYYAKKSCWQYSQCAIALLPVHTPLFRLLIVNMIFANLNGCRLLCYHVNINREYGNATAVYIMIRNVTVIHNSAAGHGFGYFNTFSIELNNFESLSEISNSIKFESVKFYDMFTIKFYNCSFMKNSNIDAMIHVTPSGFSEIEGYIVISNFTTIKMFISLELKEKMELYQIRSLMCSWLIS